MQGFLFKKKYSFFIAGFTFILLFIFPLNVYSNGKNEPGFQIDSLRRLANTKPDEVDKIIDSLIENSFLKMTPTTMLNFSTLKVMQKETWAIMQSQSKLFKSHTTLINAKGISVP